NPNMVMNVTLRQKGQTRRPNQIGGGHQLFPGRPPLFRNSGAGRGFGPAPPRLADEQRGNQSGGGQSGAGQKHGVISAASSSQPEATMLNSRPVFVRKLASA